MFARDRLLHIIFNVLYGRLAFAHEIVGGCAFGAAWDGRRALIADSPRSVSETIADLGCGEGRLLLRLQAKGFRCFGIEPSRRMSRRAASLGCIVIRGVSGNLPLHTGSIITMVCTYPGPWILSPETHDELARVVALGGRMTILLGGTYTRGRGARMRRTALRIAYGGGDLTVAQFPIPGFSGELETRDDTWGQALVWSGFRV